MERMDSLAPGEARCFGQKVLEARGTENAEAVLSPDETAARLRGRGAEIVLDLGPASPGGYPVFRISAVRRPTGLRISYADRLLVFEHQRGRNIGDFERGQCKYLGVELPALPANPGRYELYTISRTGEYLFPLIQGQQRFVRIALEEDGDLDLGWFCLHYTSDRTPVEGSFDCDDRTLTELYRISLYTVRLATIRTNQWDLLNRKLLLRSLNRAPDAGVHRDFGSLGDCEMEAEAWIARNPDQSSGIGLVLRGREGEAGYDACVDLDGCVRCYRRRKGVREKILYDGRIPPLTDSRPYRFRYTAQGSRFRLELEGEKIAEFEDGTFASGSFGFCQTIEKWAVVTALRLRSEGKLVYEEDFTSLERYTIFLGRPFLADGAKRDRLPWSGDLDWSGRNAYYGRPADRTCLRDTIDLLLARQTPEGYLQATCYPEDRGPLRPKEWGNYESDLFSAWTTAVAEDYVLYSGDLGWLRKRFKRLAKSLCYLIPYVGADGLFNQRYETSKGLWDHQLGDRGKHAYNNVIMAAAFRDGATLAGYLGRAEEETLFGRYYRIIREALNERLFDAEGGYFIKSAGRREYCGMANAAALSEHMVSPERAAGIAEAMKGHDFSHGKVLLMAIRGLYEYGFEDQAFRYLVSDNDFQNNWNFTGSVSWCHIPEREDCPHTTTECMHFPPAIDETLGSWGDLSHPDTAVAHILCGEILGVRPTQPGYREFLFQPRVGPLKVLNGVVPTPSGDISVRIRAGEDGLRAAVEKPEKLRMRVGGPFAELTVNGRPVCVSNHCNKGGTVL